MRPAHLYPPVWRWTIPSVGLDATLAGLLEGGRRGVEAGVLWLGPRASESTVTAVVLPRGPGVLQRSGTWSISPEALGVVTTWASKRGVSLLGIAHCHGGPWVQMSQTDRDHLVHAPDMLAIIVGMGGRETDLNRWGWNLFEDGRYREMLGPERRRRVDAGAGGSCGVFEASAGGVIPVFA